MCSNWGFGRCFASHRCKECWFVVASFTLKNNNFLPHIDYGVFYLLQAWMIFVAIKNNEAYVITIVKVCGKLFLRQGFGTSFVIHGAKVMK